MSIIEELIRKKKIIFCLGAGGVGKTTSATAMAIAAAMSGRKTALLSIDPAKRLAAALGMNLGFELSEVKLPSLTTGSLHATMLDQKTVFDDMVTRSTPDEKLREKILNHSLYKAASNNFGGAIEYMALAKLHVILQSGRFDIVIVDTPPDAHALDFLAKPDILSGFMDSKVMNWVIKPFHLAQKMGVAKLFMMGEKFAGGLAQVAGIKALQNLAEFLVLMQDTIREFHAAGDFLQHQLSQSSTAFCVVSTPRSAPIRSCLVILEQLRALGRGVDLLLVNRIIAPDIAASAKSFSAPPDGLDSAQMCLASLKSAVESGEQQLVYLLESVKKIFPKPLPTQYVFDQTFEIHSSEGVMLLANTLLRNEYVKI